MASTLTPAKLLQIALHYSIYSSFILFTLGTIGNSINIIVFTHLKFLRNNRCILYLTVESISNFLSQLFSVLVYISIAVYEQPLITSSFIWCRTIYVSLQVLSLITLSMICLASADQFFSTDYRWNLRHICTHFVARWLIFVSICIWILHGIICSLFVNIVPLGGCTITNEKLIEYFTYFFYPVLVGFFPIIIVSAFSLLAYRNVRHIVRRQVAIQRRRLDRQITAMVLSRVMCYVSVSLFYVIYRVYIVNTSLSNTDFMRYAILQVIQGVIYSINSLNQTMNFYIFIIVSSRYRRQVKHVLFKKYWQRWKNWCCTRENQVHPENVVTLEWNNELE